MGRKKSPSNKPLDSGDSEESPQETLVEYNGKNLKIAILDDDQMFLKIIQKTTKPLNVDFDLFDDPKMFLRSNDSTNYDAAVIDLHLSNGHNGLDVALSLYNIPIIIISSTVQSQLSQKKWPFTVRGFVHKDQGIVEILNQTIKLAATN